MYAHSIRMKNYLFLCYTFFVRDCKLPLRKSEAAVNTNKSFGNIENVHEIKYGGTKFTGLVTDKLHPKIYICLVMNSSFSFS